MSFTADVFIEAVRDILRIPSGTSAADNQSIIDRANEEIYSVIDPVVTKFEEEYYVTSEDIAIVANQSDYDIPSDASGSTIRRLNVIDGDNEAPADFVELESAYRYDESSSAGSITNYTVVGDKIRLLPTPKAAFGSLRVYYYRRPSLLVAPGNYGVVSTVNLSGSDTDVAIEGDTWAGLGPSLTADVRSKRPHFGYIAKNVAITNVNTATDTITIAGDYTSEIVAGDIITEHGECGIPDLPDMLQYPLRIFVALSVADSLGRQDIIPRLEKRLSTSMKAISRRMEGRQRGNPSFVKARSGFIRGRRRW